MQHLYASSAVVFNIVITLPRLEGFKHIRQLGDVFGQPTNHVEIKIPTMAAREQRTFVFELTEQTNMVPMAVFNVKWQDKDRTYLQDPTAVWAESDSDKRAATIDIVRKQAVEESHRALQARDAGKAEEAAAILEHSKEVSQKKRNERKKKICSQKTQEHHQPGRHICKWRDASAYRRSREA